MEKWKVNKSGIFSGYRGEENQSIIAMKWLKWISTEQNLRIEHARNGFERKVGGYKVDGYHEPTHTVYEFNVGFTSIQDLNIHGFFCRVVYSMGVYAEKIEARKFLTRIIRWKTHIRLG